MRHKDENKIKAIDEAVIDLFMAEGAQNVSISKIAKRAGVSQATIYIYYADKEAMLSHVYLGIKELFDGELFARVDEGSSAKAQLVTILMNFVHASLRHPREAFVMQSVNDNPSLVSAEAFAAGLQQSKQLGTLYQRALKEDIIRDISPALVVAFTFQPLRFLVTDAYRRDQELTDAEVNTAIEMCWNAIKA